MGIPADQDIPYLKLKYMYKRWLCIHGPKPEKPPELTIGKVYLCLVSQDTFIQGEVLSGGDRFVIRLDKPEPNLIYVKKGFVNKNEIRDI